VKDGDERGADGLRPVLQLRDAVLLVVSSIIGVGIFLTPAGIAEALPHPLLFLGAWVVGAVLSLAGAFANAELGAMYPRAGGDYVYLREAIHPAAGVVVGWLSFFAIYAGSIATLAIGFGEGLEAFVKLPPWSIPFIAVAMILFTTLVNSAGVLAGAWLNNVVTAAKVLAMVGLVVLVVVAGKGSAHNLVGGVPWPRVGFASLGAALSPVLFSYLGWNASVYVASEMRRPQRDLPLSLLWGLAISAVIYLLVTASYVFVLGTPGVAGAKRVAEATAQMAVGSRSASLIGGLVLLSVFGTLNASVLVGPRIAYAMARDGLAPRAVGVPDARTGAPAYALWGQAAFACGLVLVLKRFPSVLDYTTFAIVLATIADTVALYVLRVRRPDVPRPYRAWGYPVVPALYIAANLVIAASMVVKSPLECGVSLLVVLAALASYAVARWFQGRNGVG
jgi:APA family basic amino acid/polyamine antiporter